MAEQDTNKAEGTQEPAEKTFTQAEMDAIIGERIARVKAKYADYDELKDKAAAFDEAAEASKSELQKAVEERDKLKAQLADIKAKQERADAVAKAAAEHGVDAELLARMSGDPDENAAYLKQTMAAVPKYGQVDDGGETPPPTVTRESIDAIKDPVERVRMRAQHMNLYQ